jgi:aspartyl-tRNA(Asn)/glutamyl-tRNA(Gln) amidotransferase subunit A
MAMASSLDQIGPFAKTAEDAAIILSSIAGKDKMDATSAASGGKKYEDFISGNIKNITIGVPKEYFGDELDKEIKDIAFESLEKFKKLGAKIKGIKMPNIKYALPTYYIITPSEVSSNMARYDGIRYGVSVDNKGKSLVNSGNLLETYLDTREVGLGDEVKRRTMLGTYTLSAGYYDAYYKKAQQVRRLIKEEFDAVPDAFEEAALFHTAQCKNRFIGDQLALVR